MPTNLQDEHPRVKRARRTREDVTVYQDRDGLGFVIFGRGLALRWEISYELEAVQRGKGQSVQLIETALRLLPAGEVIYAQIPPGNAASLRAALATGFRPIGTEVLFKSRDLAPM